MLDITLYSSICFRLLSDIVVGYFILSSSRDCQTLFRWRNVW